MGRRIVVILALLVLAFVVGLRQSSLPQQGVGSGFAVAAVHQTVRLYDLSRLRQMVPKLTNEPPEDLSLTTLMSIAAADQYVHEPSPSSLRPVVRAKRAVSPGERDALRRRLNLAVGAARKTADSNIRYLGDLAIVTTTEQGHRRIARRLAIITAAAGPTEAQQRAGLSQPIPQGSDVPTFEPSPVERKMAAPLPQVFATQRGTIHEELDRLQEASGIQIDLAPTGQSQLFRLTARATGSTASAALSDMLAQASQPGLSFAWWVDGDRIVVGLYSDAIRLMHTRLYDVQSILGPVSSKMLNRHGLSRADKADLIIREITRTIAPATWEGFDNTMITELGGYIIVTHVFEVHQYVKPLIDEMKKNAINGNAPELALPP
jgi:hypothetical protein